MVTRTPTAQTAVRIAQEAALLIRTTARPRRVLRLKSSAYDVLTATDLKVERYVRRRLRGAFPEHRVIGEEGDGAAEVDLAVPTWFVDPVDGTTNYFHGLPLVACNLALWDGSALRVGVTADVMRSRTFWAERDRGAWLGRTRLTVSETADLGSAVVSTGFPYDRATVADNNLAEFAAVVPRVRDVRRIGCAGLDTSFVAAGLLDAYWEQQDGPWDWAAGALLVREAGGRVTTYEGRDWLPGDDTFVASNGRVHDALLGLITEARAGVPARR